MKKLSLLIVALFSSTILFSQDQLFKKDNSKLEVKVLEITPTEIKYKLFNNLDGPQYIILKSDAALIIYKNGDHEAFKTTESQPIQVPVYVNTAPSHNSIDSFFIKKEIRKVKHYEDVTKGKNVVFINTAEILNSSLGLNYLREFFQNTIDVHVPLAFSLGGSALNLNTLFGTYTPNGATNYKLNQKAFDIGLGIYVNTSGKRAITHFIGPLFRFAQFNGSYQIYTYNYNGGYSSNNSLETYGFVMNQTYAMLNNGFLYRLTPQFNVMINIAVGIVTSRNYLSNDPAKTITSYNNYSYNNTYTAQFGFCFGYRF